MLISHVITGEIGFGNANIQVIQRVTLYPVHRRDKQFTVLKMDVPFGFPTDEWTKLILDEMRRNFLLQFVITRCGK